jgi:hypothetical protein
MQIGFLRSLFLKGNKPIERIILKQMLKTYDIRRMDEFTWQWIGKVYSSCKHDNETFVAMKCEDIFNQHSDF